MAQVKLHRCSWTFLHTDKDMCWRVERALVDQGIDFEIVKHGYGKSHREEVEQLSGQKLLPVIQFEDASAYRAETDEMVARIRAGKLFSAAD
jgi:glutathione S-transferase